MGIEHDGVGGIGIELDGKMVETLIKNKIFSETEWDDDESECLEKIGLPYSQAGNSYSGNLRWYLLVPGDSLPEVNDNAPEFLIKLRGFGCEISMNDLVVVSDYHVY